MRLRTLVAAITVIACCSTTSLVAGERAGAASFAHGQDLLSQGQFQAAFDAFTKAAKAEPDNEEYIREAALLRRVMTIQEKLVGSDDRTLWERMGRGLYNYYQQRGAHKSALDLAQSMHGKLETPESAWLLADANLELGNDARAAGVIESVPREQRDAHCYALHGIALARQNQLDEARTSAAKVNMPKEPDVELCYELARLHALLGNGQQAIKLLTVTFEQTPEGWQPDVRKQATRCADFGDLKDTPAFAKALNAKSKVKGGCGGCSKKGGCSGEKSCADKDKKSCADDKEKDEHKDCEHK